MFCRSDCKSVFKVLSLSTEMQFSTDLALMNTQPQPEAALQRCLKKRCSENMQQIYRRAPMPKCDFNNVSKQLYWYRISAWVFSCKFAAYFENTFCYKTPLVAASAQRIKVDDATRTNDDRGISWCSDSCRGKLLNLVSLTNLFEMLYPHLL